MKIKINKILINNPIKMYKKIKITNNNLNKNSHCNPISYWHELIHELIDLIDHINRMYESRDTTIPYQDLRYNLIVGKIDVFIELLKSLLASLSYSMYKISEK